jgi:glycosyltransferase involved in cell wall biosynthesis
MECVAGDIDAALQVISSGGARAQDVIFHLHWLNALFRGTRSVAAAQKVAQEFEQKLQRLRAAGARVVWTVHNHLSHDTPFPDIERALSARIAHLADRIHLHCAGQEGELENVFALPPEKIRIARHGHYVGAYPDYIDRIQARAALGIDPHEDVILFTGMIRPYKGVDHLITAFRRILADRPQARLILAGLEWLDPFEGHALTDFEQARILRSGRFVAEHEIQVFFRAADIAAYPYQRILTSGSLMLALSFGVPVVSPQSAMAAEVLGGTAAGILYPHETGPGDDAVQPLEQALRAVLGQKDAGRLPMIFRQARARAAQQDWQDFGSCVLDMGPVV